MQPRVAVGHLTLCIKKHRLAFGFPLGCLFSFNTILDMLDTVNTVAHPTALNFVNFLSQKVCGHTNTEHVGTCHTSFGVHVLKEFFRNEAHTYSAWLGRAYPTGKIDRITFLSLVYSSGVCRSGCNQGRTHLLH